MKGVDVAELEEISIAEGDWQSVFRCVRRKISIPAVSPQKKLARPLRRESSWCRAISGLFPYPICTLRLDRWVATPHVTKSLPKRGFHRDGGGRGGRKRTFHLESWLPVALWLVPLVFVSSPEFPELHSVVSRRKPKPRRSFARKARSVSNARATCRRGGAGAKSDASASIAYSTLA